MTRAKAEYPAGLPAQGGRIARCMLLVFAALLCAGGVLTDAARAQSSVTLTITNSPGYAIPTDFNGLSFETGTLPGGSFFNAANSPLITLFGNLGIRNLRIGGGTSDGPTASVPSNSDIDALFGFAQAVSNLHVIYSFRLHNGSSATDAAAAQYIWTNYRPQLASFALGNEPDWQSAQKQDPALTNYTSYLTQWRTFAAAVTNVVPGATFSGPDTGGNFDNGPPDGSGGIWANNGAEWTTSFATDERSSGIVTLVTQHHYVANTPAGIPPITSAAVMLNAMLSPSWDTVTNQILYNVMGAPVLADGLPYRLTEAEDCVGGVPGASDTFAGALWALDFLHWWALHQCAGVNFHNSRWKTNTVITVNNNPGGQLSVYPKGYGLKAFDLGGHGNEEPVAMVNTNSLNLTAYAVSDSTNLYVTLINKEHGTGARDASLTITLSGFSSGSVAAMYLTAPNGDVAATNGVTLGGASITNNAPWVGQWTALGAVTNGRCMVTVTAASAAVVRIAVSPGGLAVVRDLPPQVTLVSGKSYQYSVGVNGALPVGYQWYRGGAPMAGQTDATYSLIAGSPGISIYSVVITNQYGAVTSSVSTLTVIAQLTDAYATKVLGYRPVGYWPLQETSAPAPATLETNYGTLGKPGNAYYATGNTTDVVFGQPGPLPGSVDTAVVFNGAGNSGTPDSYAFVPRVLPALTLQPPLTLEAWVKSSSTAFGDMMGEGGSGLNSPPNAGNGGGLRLSYGGNYAGGPDLQLYVYNGSGLTRPSIATPADSLAAGAWHHCVATFDGANACLYVDGVQEANGPLTMAIDTWSPLTIGAGMWQGVSH
jgi:hypothetical protein